MLGAALGVAGGDGFVVGGHYRVAGAWRVPAEPLGGVEVRRLLRFLRHEALLGRLPGDAHALADVGPGGTGTPGLVHEVADQVVGDIAQVVGRDDRVLELVEGGGVDLLDGVDEVVETYGRGDVRVGRHVSTLG